MKKLTVLGYLGTGIAHERLGLPCQDAIGNRYCENGSVVLALSDGASSARYAQQAARACVAAVLSLFDSVPLSAFLALEATEQKRRILAACCEALTQLPGYAETDDFSDYASTLLFCVRDAENLLIGHIGDGMAFAADGEGENLFTSEPENAEELSNRTFFVTSSDSLAHLRLNVIDLHQSTAPCVLLVSDGPYAMLQGRSGGFPQKTAQELLSYVRDGGVSTNEQLADVLRQMAELPCERLDDWAVLILSSADAAQEELPQAVSMLAEEEEKYAEN